MVKQLHEARLVALRQELARDGLDGFFIPISDEHMSEYVGAYARRLEWLTGFRGSAGTAVVLAGAAEGQAAAMFVDGRYTQQMRDQVDGCLYDCCETPLVTPAAWTAAHAPGGARIGFDPWLHSQPWVDATRAMLSARGVALVAVADNPLDRCWKDRPAPSMAPVFVHPLEMAGQSSHAKRERIGLWLAGQGLDAAVICALDSVAWLLNMRGADVARTPVALSFAIVHADGGADWFIAPEKVPADIAPHVGENVRLYPREAFPAALANLGGKAVALDPVRSVAAIRDALGNAGARIVEAMDPCVLPKAIKNATEQAGARAAQLRDGVAMVRFLHWLSVEGPKGALTELSAAQALYSFRCESPQLHDLSFDTIAGAGPNAAMAHYCASEETNRILAPGSVFLVDSGGQYVDGTTDITRTVWIGGVQTGRPDAEVRERFTRVLKGHIALASAVFPVGTTGGQIDVLARRHLWAAGLNYAHGTGHGVGSFLAVHEGPQRIGASTGEQGGAGHALMAGMILSNEPGYYKAGAYGIRIENLMLVEERAIEGGEGGYLGFEMLTYVPIARDLVDLSLMSATEIAWWNDYHARVWTVLAPHLAQLRDDAARSWLKEQCQFL